MTVTAQKRFLYLFLFLLTLPQFISSKLKCDRDLMNSFKLSGLVFPTKEPLHICGGVTSNCCTIFDELTIIKLWKDFSFPRVKQFVTNLIVLYDNIFEFEKYITEMSLKAAQSRVVEKAWVPYKKKYCTMLEGVEGLGRYNPNKIVSQHFDDHRDSILEKNSRKLFFGKVKSFFNKGVSSATSAIDDLTGASAYKKKLEEHKKKQEKQIAEIKKKVEKRRKELEDKQKKDFDEKQKDAFAKMAEVLAVKSVRSASHAQEMYLEKLQTFLDQSRENLPEIEFNNIKKTKAFLYEGKIYFEDLPNKLISQTDKHNDFLNKLRKHLFDGLEIETQALRTSMAPLFTDIVIDEFTQHVKDVDLPGEAKAYMPNPEEMDRVLPEFPELFRSKQVCVTQSHKLYKYFYLYNTIKQRFCMKAKTNILRIRSIDIKGYLGSLKREAESIFEMKRGVYCSVCDAEQHQFFDHEKNILYYNQEFCHDMIFHYKDYIKFNNIVFAEYADELLQYLYCVTSDPSVIEFPTKTIYRQIKLKVVFFKRCFENLHRDDYMKYCYFICKEFRMNGLHAYIEGDVDNIYNLFIRIMDVLRKEHIPFQLRNHVDIESIRKLDHFLYKGKITDRFERDNKDVIRHDRVLEEEEKEKKEGDPDAPVTPSSVPSYNVSIYGRREKAININHFESVYLDEEGLNIVNEFQNSDFDINMDKYVRHHFNKGGPAVLREDVIRTVFGQKIDDLHKFNTDAFINVIPDSVIKANGQQMYKDLNYDHEEIINSYNATSSSFNPTSVRQDDDFDMMEHQLV